MISGFHEYRAFVKSIWTEPEKHTERGLAIAGLGLIGEAAEVAEKIPGDAFAGLGVSQQEAVYDECGDVLYYLTVLADWRGLDIADLVDEVFNVLGHVPHKDFTHGGGLVVACKEVSERVKKLIRDGREYEQVEFKNHAYDVLKELADVLELASGVMGDALRANVQKLEKRYAGVLGAA